MIALMSTAIKVLPLEHPNQSNLLFRLGSFLYLRYKRTKSEDDLERYLSSYIGAWECTHSPPSDRVRAALRAGGFLALESRWNESYQIERAAVELLIMISPRSI